MYQVCRQHIEKQQSVSLEEVTDYVREMASPGRPPHAQTQHGADMQDPPAHCQEHMCMTDTTCMQESFVGPLSPSPTWAASPRLT